MARTAVVAGTATAVSNRVSRRQADRWYGQDPYQPQQYAEPGEDEGDEPAEHPAGLPSEIAP